MKAKINLYNRNPPKGRIDTFSFTPYQKVDRENQTSIAYSVNYSQACLLLQAIQVNGRGRLSSECILRLATFIGQAWETDPSRDKIDQLVKLMSSLLDTTMLCPEKTLDEALKQFCDNNIPTHSVSPSITLLIAISYIERLKQRYHNIKGTSGCGNRLILVAYMMAAKYMHVNLKSLIKDSSPASTTTSLPNTTNDTLLPPIQSLPSPPTSPTNSHSDSDPLNYHYFRQAEEKPVHRDYHYPILRMELEFLHFLNYDLNIQSAFKLIHWAKKFDDQLLPPMHQGEYTSGDEGDDKRNKNI